MSLDRSRPKNYKRAWNRGIDLVAQQRAMQDVYIAGVELRRGKLITAKEKDEIRDAWLAGCIYGSGYASTSGAEHE